MYYIYDLLKKKLKILTGLEVIQEPTHIELSMPHLRLSPAGSIEWKNIEENSYQGTLTLPLVFQAKTFSKEDALKKLIDQSFTLFQLTEKNHGICLP